MSLPKPPVLPAWAEAQVNNTANVVEPPVSELQAGWPLSGTPPPRQYFNWLLNFCSNGIRYLCERGLPDWDPAETYSIGDVVRGDDGLIRASRGTTNINNRPSTTDTNSSLPLPWWGPVQALTPPAIDGSTSVATTAFVAGKITSSHLVWNQPSGPIFYKIATLPPGNGSEAGGVYIRARINAGNFNLEFVLDGAFNVRGQFGYLYNACGPNTSNFSLVAYRETNGQVSVYLQGITGLNAYADVAVTNIGYIGPTPGNLVVYPSPPAFTASVTGTNIFSSAPGSATPPVLSAINSGTYLNATQISAIYANLNQLNALNVSLLNAINAAIAPLAPLLSPQLTGNPQSPNPLFGNDSAAIATTHFVQTALNRGASLAASGYLLLGLTGNGNTPLILQWGLVQGVNGGAGPVNVTFPTAFPNVCAAAHASSKRNLVGTVGTGCVQNLAGTAGTTLSLNGMTVVCDRDADGVQRAFWFAIGW